MKSSNVTRVKRGGEAPPVLLPISEKISSLLEENKRKIIALLKKKN